MNKKCNALLSHAILLEPSSAVKDRSSKIPARMGRQKRHVPVDHAHKIVTVNIENKYKY